MASDTTPGLEPLTEDRCWQLLAKKRVGRLALVLDDGPDIFPVNYRIDDESLIVRTDPGLKLAAASARAPAAFEVDALDELHQTGWSVVVRGPVAEIVDPDELIEVRRLLVEPWTGGTKSHYLRLSPSQVTGRELPGSG